MRNMLPIYISLIAIVIIVLSRRPADMLRRRGAVSPDTAQPLDDISPADRRRLERLMAQGLVREASPGRYYFDVAAERARLRSRMPWLLALIALLFAAAIVLHYYNTRSAPPLP